MSKEYVEVWVDGQKRRYTREDYDKMNAAQKAELERMETYKEKTGYCSKCNTKMIEGYIMPLTATAIIAVGGGVFWTRDDVGTTITSRVGLQALLCPNCGHIEFRVKDPEDLKRI